MYITNFGILFTILITLLPTLLTTASTLQHFNISATALSDPPFNAFQVDLTAEQGLIEVKHLPPNPLTSSWTYFTFMSRNKAVPPSTYITFSLVVPQLDTTYASPRTCTLPGLVTPSSIPLPYPNNQRSQMCIAVDNFNDPTGLSPMFAGEIIADLREGPNTCQLAFLSSKQAYIPPLWKITCVTQFPSTLTSQRSYQQTEFVLVKFSTLTLDDDWRLVDESPPQITQLKQPLVWLDFAVDYKARTVEDSFGQRVDELILKFANLPPNITLPLEFAFDVNDLDRLDHLVFLQPDQAREWANAMQLMNFPTTNFQSPIHPNEARFIFSSPTDGSAGFYLITGNKPPSSVEFNLPVPLHTIISMMMLPDDRMSSKFWPAHRWHGKNIAVYVRLQHQRLFRFDSIDENAKWNFRTPLLHQYHYYATTNTLEQTEYEDKQWKTGILSLSSHFILIGSSPSIQITDFRGHSLRSEFWDKLIKPVKSGGYLAKVEYFTSPFLSNAEVEATSYGIPIALFDPNPDPDPTASKFSFAPYTFAFSSDPRTPYFGYANITITFQIPSADLYSFSLDFLLNNKYRRSISVYPRLGYGFNQLNVSANEDGFQVATPLTADHTLALLYCIPIFHYLNYTKIGFNAQCQIGFQKDRQDIPTLWTLSVSRMLVGGYEVRPESALATPPKCHGVYSANDVELDPVALYSKYNIPLPTHSAIHFTHGIAEALLPVISKDQAVWTEIEAYMFPNVELQLICAYPVLPDLIKPSTFGVRQAFHAMQGVRIEQIFQGVDVKPTWDHRDPEPVLNFIVQYTFPILTDSDFQDFLNSFITILQTAKYFRDGPTEEPVESLFKHITTDSIYVNTNITPTFGHSYQHSGHHFSSLIRDEDEFDSYKHSLFSYSQYNSAVLVFSIPDTFLLSNTPNSLSSNPSPSPFNLLSSHAFTPHKHAMISSIGSGEISLSQPPVFMGGSTPPRPYPAQTPSYGTCYSRSSCIGEISPGQCIKGKCFESFRQPELTPHEYFIYDQAMLHKEWLSEFSLPPVPERVDEPTNNTLLMIILSVLIAVALVGVVFIIYDCYCIHKRQKQRQVDQEEVLLNSIN